KWRTHGSAAVLLGTALAATGTCIRLLEMQHGYRAAFWLWTSALLLATVAAIVGGANRLRVQFPRLNRSHVIEAGIILGLLVMTVALRAPKLVEIPPEVHGDEAECGIDARRVLRGEIPTIFGFGWYGVPYLSFGISAASMRFFGDDLHGLRMASVLQGT